MVVSGRELRHMLKYEGPYFETAIVFLLQSKVLQSFPELELIFRNGKGLKWMIRNN